MAWRLDEAVIKGEIDNRTRGVVTGKIWLLEREHPLELELAGNAWRDLAGRRLEFVNPVPRPLPIVNELGPQQRGVVGDLTASRKIKVHPCNGLTGEPESWSNGIYLEWFNTANERVLIEAVSYWVTISRESSWEMTAEEEQRQRERNAAAMATHRARLIAAEADEEGDGLSGKESREESAGGRIEEPASADDGLRAIASSSELQLATTVNTLADVGEALSAATMLIQILDTESGSGSERASEQMIDRLSAVGQELDRARSMLDLCERQGLAEKAWIEEVQQEIGSHATECARLIAELRERLRRIR